MKTEEAVAYLVKSVQNLVNMTGKKKDCKKGWSRFENDCFQISSTTSAWLSTMCNYGKEIKF